MDIKEVSLAFCPEIIQQFLQSAVADVLLLALVVDGEHEHLFLLHPDQRYHPRASRLALALGGNAWSAELNIIGFTMLFAPLSMIVGIGMNWLSRKNEFEADAFAKETYAGKPLAEALKTLFVKTLSSINPHPWYVFVNYSHPPLLERLEKLEK